MTRLIDANLQNEFMKLQKKLHTTVVLVTHDIGEAMKWRQNCAHGSGKTTGRWNSERIVM